MECFNKSSMVYFVFKARFMVHFLSGNIYPK